MRTLRVCAGVCGRCARGCVGSGCADRRFVCVLRAGVCWQRVRELQMYVRAA